MGLYFEAGDEYNPLNAEFVGIYDHGIPGRYGYRREELFKTRSGRYFLYVVQSAAAYSVTERGKHTIGAEMIKPISTDAAEAWIQKYGAMDYAPEPDLLY